jgi:hypothetical protein
MGAPLYSTKCAFGGLRNNKAVPLTRVSRTRDPFYTLNGDIPKSARMARLAACIILWKTALPHTGLARHPILPGGEFPNLGWPNFCLVFEQS